MRRFGILLLGLVLTSGCEMVYVVPPANGRVVDVSSGQPVAKADVTREHADAPAKTKTNAKGYFKFHGKRHLQVALGDPVLIPASYRIEAVGYYSFQTNRFIGLWANRSGLRDDLGTIQITPK